MRIKNPNAVNEQDAVKNLNNEKTPISPGAVKKPLTPKSPKRNLSPTKFNGGKSKQNKSKQNKNKSKKNKRS